MLCGNGLQLISKWSAIVASLLLIIFCGCDSSEPDSPSEAATTRGEIIRVDELKRYTSGEVNQVFEDFGLPITARYGVNVYIMEYMTVDVKGEMTLASGAVLIPQPAFSELSVVSFHSFTTVNRLSVPSRGGLNQILVGMIFSGDGYMTVMPDMIGLGSSTKFHPYLIADVSATTVIDMLRSVTQWATSESWSISQEVFLTGYSAGGYITLATHRAIEADVSDEYKVVASAPMAGPYDLSGTMFELMLRDEPYGQPYFLPYILMSYSEAYGLYESPSDYLASPYDETLPPLFDGTHSSADVNAAMPEIPKQIVRSDVLQRVKEDMNHKMIQRLRENDLINWKPRSPIRLYHCAADALVPIENAQIAVQRFGSIATLVDPSPQSGHTSCGLSAIAGARAWFNSTVTNNSSERVQEPVNHHDQGRYMIENQ